MNNFFSFAPSAAPSQPSIAPHPDERSAGTRLGPEPVRIFRAPALPAFQPCGQEVPFSAHLGPRIREPV